MSIIDKRQQRQDESKDEYYARLAASVDMSHLRPRLIMTGNNVYLDFSKLAILIGQRVEFHDGPRLVLNEKGLSSLASSMIHPFNLDEMFADMIAHRNVRVVHDTTPTHWGSVARRPIGWIRRLTRWLLTNPDVVYPVIEFIK